ncbi:hypothetical protein LG821_000702 [Vibrio parahaemolyticus]|nr:hypothetical protein [Vibrio parahaemolyticus]
MRMSINDRLELQDFKEYIFPDYLDTFRDFGRTFSISNDVEFDNDVMTIDFLTYKFVSKHQLVFKEGVPYLRAKFETTTIDDLTYFFDIYIDRYGRFETKFSDMLNERDMGIFKNASAKKIDKYIAELIFNFFEINKIS